MFKRYVVAGLLVATALLTGCSKPDWEEVVEIKPNETAFLIKLEGDTQAGQKQFMSEAFLEQNKIATKRITIPHRKRDMGGLNSYEWIPTVKLITVDRTPVTREWTRSKETGTNASNQAISVESKESIDFSIGVTVTGSIPEELASKFLYNFAGKPLSEVMDTNVRGYVQSILSREFGGLSLDDARTQKRQIFDMAFKETKEYFTKKGVQIDNLGYSEGMTYTDSNIQKSINETFQAEMAVQKAKQKVEEAKQTRAAAEEFAKAKEAASAKADVDIKLMLAQAELNRSLAAMELAKHPERLPAVVPQGTQLLNGLDALRK